jgi:hypothetical protein
MFCSAHGRGDTPTRPLTSLTLRIPRQARRRRGPRAKPAATSAGSASPAALSTGWVSRCCSKGPISRTRYHAGAEMNAPTRVSNSIRQPILRELSS